MVALSSLAGTLMDVSRTFQRINMHPYFDLANYILMCSIVKDDSPQIGSQSFSRRHPFACWLASMLMCFAGPIVANCLLGESMVSPFKNNHDILLASAVWYLINYMPWDLAYKISKFAPLHLLICLMKELQRARKICDGVAYAYKLNPGAYLVVVAIGVVKGSGYLEMKLFERLVRGFWMPASNECLQPSFTTKASCLIAIAFLLEKLGQLPCSKDGVFLAALLLLVCYKLAYKFLHVHDPFRPFEGILCSLLLGGLVDALRRAAESGRVVAPAVPTRPGQAVGGQGQGQQQLPDAAGGAAANGHARDKEQKKNE